MKKLIIIIPLIMLISGCIVIEERYRTPGPRVAPVEYYDYYPSYYSSYYGYYPYPNFYWMGTSWWNPFWYYGFYNYYYGWYSPSYGRYYHYYPRRYYRGSDTITKGQLRDPNKTRVSGRNIRTVDRKSASSLSRGKSKTSIRGRVSRVRPSRVRSIKSTRRSSVSRTRSSVSRTRSSGSKSSVKKKK